MFTGQQGCFYSKKCLINPEKNCRVSRLTYEVRCKTCGDDPNEKEALYYGTSGFTLHKRLKEHEAEIRTNQQSNAMENISEPIILARMWSLKLNQSEGEWHSMWTGFYMKQ